MPSPTVSDAGTTSQQVLDALRQMTRNGSSAEQIKANILYWIAQIDNRLSEQLNEILHAPEFQRLESTWRGLYYLVCQSQTGPTLKIRVLNVTKRALLRDLEKAVEFDQSALFKKVYEEEYGQLGGEPYGLLVGDFEFTRHPEDISLLRMISNVAASAHAPFVAAASPRLFGLDSFQDLFRPRDLLRGFLRGEDYVSWRAFRDSEDARYTALTLPRVLARLPYGRRFQRVREFNYEENVDGPDDTKYLWMNAAWAFAGRVTDVFSQYGWFARLRGVEGGGRVEGLPVSSFPTDEGVVLKSSTEIAIADRREFELSSLGFLPLLHARYRDFPVFMGVQSCQKPRTYNDPRATANAELSAKFNYLLCVSRFAHYLKVLARDKIGSGMEREHCERFLNEWVMEYVIGNPELASDEVKAQKPLVGAHVQVRSIPGKPGRYQAVAHLQPHFQLDTLVASLRLVAEVPKRN